MKTPDRYCAGSDRYVSSKVLAAVLPRIYGKQGETIVSLYRYLRWLDDELDENIELSKENKIELVRRGQDLSYGKKVNHPNEFERGLTDVDWGKIPDSETVKKYGRITIHGMGEDVGAQDLRARETWRLRHIDMQTLFSPVEATAILINGHGVKPTFGLIRLLDSWDQLGNLNHLEEDLEYGICKLRLSFDERKAVNDAPVEARKNTILEFMTEEKFYKQKHEYLKRIIREAPAFFALDMPLWQRIVSYLYMWEIVIKKSITVRYPQTNL